MILSRPPLKNVILYEIEGVEYITLLRWKRYQRPKHFKPSILPKPPIEPYPEEETSSPPSSPPSSPTTSSPRSGQSSQGKVSIGKVSAVEEDFKRYFNSETDLTDFLMKTLNDYMSAGRERARQSAEATPEKERVLAAQWGMPVVEKFWDQTVGSKLPGLVWQGAYSALQKYPMEVVARAFVKAGRYQGGKHKSWKYIQTIIDEEMEKRGRSPPHS